MEDSSVLFVDLSVGNLLPYSPKAIANMHAEIKAIFDHECADLTVDRILAMKIHRYVVDFINRNRDHSEFFGGNLTGVNVVRFVDADKHRWFDEILGVNEHDLRERISKLAVVRGKDGDVFNVAGDPLNQSCVWLCYKFHNATKMSVAERSSAIRDILLALQFKFLTSRLFRHWKYPTDRATAEATYAKLSNKFSIKSYGTWLKVLEARCADIVDPVTSSHFETIARMDNDKKVVMMLNDIQGRIRDMLKNIFRVFLEVKASGDRIVSSSGTVEFDGVEVLKDRSRGLQTYTNYLKSIVSDKNSFIRAELLKVNQDIAEHAPPKHVRVVLEYISNNYMKSGSQDIGKLIDMVMVHSFRYMETYRTTIQAGIDLVKLLERLKGVYTSSRSVDPDLIELRSYTEKIVADAIDSKTPSVISAVRTAVLLYLVSRAYTMRHYANL